MLRAHLKKLLPLPHRFLLGGKTPIVVDRLQEGHLDYLCDLFITSGKDGLGVGSEEFTRDSVQDLITTSDTFSLVDVDTDQCMGATIHYPSKLHRSTLPVHQSNWLILDHKYRGSGGLGGLMYLVGRIAIDLGYIGLGALSTLHSPTLRTGTKMGGYVTGVIHNDIILNKYGLTDNIVCYQDYKIHWDYTDAQKQIETERMATPLPTLGETVPSNLYNPIDFHEKKMTLTSGSDILIRAVRHDDIMKVETLLRRLAEAGDGVGIDEFTAEGFFNRRLIKKCHVTVAVTSSGDIAGVAMFGRSVTCRMATPYNAWCYVFVDTQHQRKGVASALLDYLEEEVARLGYNGLCTDIYATSRAGIQMFSKAGFPITGSVHKSGCVQGYGFVDTILLYKRLS